jgi:hypothetical protein
MKGYVIGCCLILALVCSCRSSSSTLDASTRACTGCLADGPLVSSDGSVDGDACGVTSACVAMVECTGPYTNLRVGTAWWRGPGAALTACDMATSHDPPQLYDDCDLSSNARLDPVACGRPAGGTVQCTGNTFSNRGRINVACYKRADCPTGMGCVYNGTVQDVPDYAGDWGLCEKICDGSNPNDCVRCDLACMNGACQPKPPAPKPCHADCECPSGNCNYFTGLCRDHMAQAPRDYCGLPGGGNGCPCTEGTCRTGCCYKSDGTVANAMDPECAGPPAP